MVEHSEEELAPSRTEGFKVGEKKTIDEVCCTRYDLTF